MLIVSTSKLFPHVKRLSLGGELVLKERVFKSTNAGGITSEQPGSFPAMQKPKGRCMKISPILVVLLKALEEQKVLIASGKCGWNYSTVNAEVAGSNPAGAAMGLCPSPLQHRSSVW